MMKASLKWMRQAIVVVKVGFYIWKESVRSFTEELDKASETTGLRHIYSTKNHWLERLLWVGILIASCFGIAFTCLYQWDRFEARPTVISLERDFRNWNLTLPGLNVLLSVSKKLNYPNGMIPLAMTVCYGNKVNESKAAEFIENKWNVSESDNDFEYFSDFIKTVVNTDIATLEDYLKFDRDERLENIDLYDMTMRVRRERNHRIIMFDNNFIIDEREVMTEQGLCFSVNGPITALLESNARTVKKFEKPLTCNFVKDQCYLKVVVYEDEATVSILSPYEVPVYDKPRYETKNSEESFAVYRVVETIVEAGLENLSIDQRKCIFLNEMVGDKAIFTGNMCFMHCRIALAMELCHCVPHHYHFNDEEVCDAAGIICLHKFAWPYISFELCECPFSCVDLKYAENSFQKRSWIVGDLPFLQKASFRVEVLTPKMRLKREIIFSFEEMIVSFGGAATLFLGISLWQISRQLLFVINKVLGVFA